MKRKGSAYLHCTPRTHLFSKGSVELQDNVIVHAISK